MNRIYMFAMKARLRGVVEADDFYVNAGILIRSTLFVMGSALVSLFLSVVWALDNLGVNIYNRKTGMSALALDHHVDSCNKKHYCPDQLHGCNPVHDKY